MILSNGQSYVVSSGKDGKDGTDGEAIIADVKIEEDFIVLTLKSGETLRISYHNPLSMVTLNIVPDFDDGTVTEPKTAEALGQKSNIFYLEVSVTPAKHAEILSDKQNRAGVHLKLVPYSTIFNIFVYTAKQKPSWKI